MFQIKNTYVSSSTTPGRVYRRRVETSSARDIEKQIPVLAPTSVAVQNSRHYSENIPPIFSSRLENEVPDSVRVSPFQPVTYSRMYSSKRIERRIEDDTQFGLLSECEENEPKLLTPSSHSPTLDLNQVVPPSFESPKKVAETQNKVNRIVSTSLVRKERIAEQYQISVATITVKEMEEEIRRLVQQERYLESLELTAKKLRYTLDNMFEERKGNSELTHQCKLFLNTCNAIAMDNITETTRSNTEAHFAQYVNISKSHQQKGLIDEESKFAILKLAEEVAAEFLLQFPDQFGSIYHVTCNNLSYSYRLKRKYKIALKYAFKLLAVIPKRYHPKEPIILENKSPEGYVKDMFEDKCSTTTQSISFVEETGGIVEDSSLVVDSFLTMGAVLSKMGKHEAALQYAMHALKISLRFVNGHEQSLFDQPNSIPKENHGIEEEISNYANNDVLKTGAVDSFYCSLVVSCSNIATEYEYLNKWKEAKKYHLNALKIAKNRLGEHNDITQRVFKDCTSFLREVDYRAYERLNRQSFNLNYSPVLDSRSYFHRDPNHRGSPLETRTGLIEDEPSIHHNTPQSPIQLWSQQYTESPIISSFPVPQYGLGSNNKHTTNQEEIMFSHSPKSIRKNQSPLRKKPTSLTLLQSTYHPTAGNTSEQ